MISASSACVASAYAWAIARNEPRTPCSAAHASSFPRTVVAARSTSWPTTMHVRHLRGRRIDHADVLGVEAERRRGDLREHRDRALADVGRARADLEPAVDRGDRRAAREPLLARAG